MNTYLTHDMLVFVNYFIILNLKSYYFLYVSADGHLQPIPALFPPPPPTSHELQYISVASGFTRLNIKTKYVCRGLISLYVSFHNNRTMWPTNLHVKVCTWGEKGKRAPIPF